MPGIIGQNAKADKDRPAGCRSDFNVACSSADSDDTESTLRVDFPAQGIGINGECRLFVLPD